jgi:Tfp pilus assembly protein PilO
MKSLSKEKQQQLILAILITLAAISGLALLVIKPQYRRRDELAAQQREAENKLHQVKLAIAGADQVEVQLADCKKNLQSIEENMASGDLYSWAINTIRQFKLEYRVDIPQFSQIDGPKDVNMLAKFPYKQACLTIGGTAHFHDLGRFLADFENQFPYIRIVNLSLEPASNLGGNDKDRLGFKFEIAALVKPGMS